MRLITTVVNRIPSGCHLLVFSFEKNKRPVGTHLYGAWIERAFQEACEDGFTGKTGQTISVSSRDNHFKKIVFIGLGIEKDATLDQLRRACAQGTKTISPLNATQLLTRAPEQLGTPEELGQAAAEGFQLGLYRFTGFQSKPTPPAPLTTLTLLAKNSEEARSLQKGLDLGHHFADSVCFARNLINRPPSDCTPLHLVNEARSLKGKNISLQIFNKTQINKLGMGALLGVNRGSGQPPYFLHLIYRPKGPVKKRIGLCGKGITFDSGGLSLKPAGSMETMKYDMSGAASVLAIFRALSHLQPSGVQVHGFTPLTENMPGENAVKPGDVLRTMKGKTIEVLNTDAEGRLILADALSFASTQKLDQVIDIATLTGACIVALGNQIAGIMGNDPGLVKNLINASQKAGEKLWELPLEKEYAPLLKSQVADLKNIGPLGQAGTIMAGLFLKEFVDDKLPWAHLDIASTGWTSTPTTLSDVGATGVLIRTLLHHILNLSK
ncbi:MAG: cytosol aminopeptidase [Elusimicrobia bacterium]|nr:cytosol aminopeptidase [Elusimicrobiota bacterium]